MDGRLFWIIEGLLGSGILLAVYWCISALVKYATGREIFTPFGMAAICVMFYVGRRMLLQQG